MAHELALILDMDGVIVDSNPVHRKVWELYNGRFGIETDEAMQQRMYGRRNDDIIRDFFGEDLTAAAFVQISSNVSYHYEDLRCGGALVEGQDEQFVHQPALDAGEHSQINPQPGEG